MAQWRKLGSVAAYVEVKNSGLGSITQQHAHFSRQPWAHSVVANRLFGGAKRRALRLALHPKPDGQMPKLLRNGPLPVSLNLLWALEGALTGLSWKLVARAHRTSLLLALEQLQEMDG